MFVYVFVYLYSNNTTMERLVLNIKEAAIYTGLSEIYLRQLCRQRMLRHYRTGGGKMIMIAKGDLDNWLTAKVVTTQK
jgi:excisionase family DNA binding protein